MHVSAGFRLRARAMRCVCVCAYSGSVQGWARFVAAGCIGCMPAAVAVCGESAGRDGEGLHGRVVVGTADVHTCGGCWIGLHSGLLHSFVAGRGLGWSSQRGMWASQVRCVPVVAVTWLLFCCSLLAR